VVASNSQTLATSEMYNAKQSALHAIGVMKDEGATGTVEDWT
jgi:uncharacterized protein YegP (UPF0339 family)